MYSPKNASKYNFRIFLGSISEHKGPYSNSNTMDIRVQLVQQLHSVFELGWKSKQDFSRSKGEVHDTGVAPFKCSTHTVEPIAHARATIVQLGGYQPRSGP